MPPFQRENREDYIAKLEEDLASLPVGQAEGKDSDDEWISSQVPLACVLQPANQKTWNTVMRSKVTHDFVSRSQRYHV